MNTRWALTLAILVGFAFSPAGTRMEYGPEQGLTLDKSFKGEFTIFLESLDVTMNGQPFPTGMADIDPSDREGVMSYNLEMQEVFNEVSDGRVTDLTRTYNTVSGEAEGGGESESQSLDELEGQSVQFVWDPETETYTHNLVDEDADVKERLLKSLSVEVDMLGLLPGGEVSVGDTWEVPGDALASLLVPGMNFEAMAEMNADKASEIPDELLGMMESLRENMDDTLIECKFEGLSGDGDQEVATISFSLASDVQVDARDILAAQIAEQDSGMEMDLEEFTIDLALELQGELLWNVNGGHFASYEVGGEVTMDAYATVAMGGDQMAMEMEGEAEASMEFSVEGSASAQ